MEHVVDSAPPRWRFGPFSARKLRGLMLADFVREQGGADAVAAERLHLSIKTIETHRAELLRRLDIHDVAGLTRYAIRRGIVSQHD